MITFFEVIGFFTCAICAVALFLFMINWLIGLIMDTYKDYLNLDLFWEFHNKRKDFEKYLKDKK